MVIFIFHVGKCALCSVRISLCNTSLTKTLKEKYFMKVPSPQVSPLFNFCLQCLKIGNVLQLSFEHFQCFFDENRHMLTHMGF
jgi:hypothetical protein